MRYLILSDTHLDPARQGGTTMASRVELADTCCDKLEATVARLSFDKLIINGDLLHKVTCSEKTLLRLFNILSDIDCILVRGNHCSLSERYGEISSLELLSALLPNSTLVFDTPLDVGPFHIIPHQFNQEDFDNLVSNVAPRKIVLLHCNFQSSFSLVADHSLNLSKEQTEELLAKGATIVLGHEHAQRDMPGVKIIGCHYPTSIYDCMSGDKRCLIYDDVINAWESHTTWSSEEYITMDWQDIRDTGHKFIRVTGECELVELPGIIRQVADLRKRSSAFIVANAVKPKVVERDTMTKEEVTAFNIIELLLEQVGEEFREEVKSCI